MKHIIMCGGNYKYWETPKQLQVVNGETLVARTIRLLRENGVTDIAISSNDKRFDNFGVPRLEHNNTFETDGKNIKGYWVDAFYPTNESVTYLFGDVYYTDYAIAKILDNTTNGVLFFGSRKINRENYHKEWEEPFAFKVANQEMFRKAIDTCKFMKDKKKTKREPIAWELYRVLNGIDINTHLIKDNYVAIDDETTDFDTPKELEEMRCYYEN